MIKIMNIILCCSIMTVSCFWGRNVSAYRGGSEHEVEVLLRQVYEKRAQAMIHQRVQVLEDDYLSDRASIHALYNENRRIKYINSWANKRAIRLVHAQTDIKFVRLKANESTATVSLVQSLQLSYDYLNRIIPVQSFGIGTRHFLTLKKIDGKW